MTVAIKSEIRISKADRAAIRREIAQHFGRTAVITVTIAKPKLKRKPKVQRGYCCWYCGNTNGHKPAYIHNFHLYYICQQCGASTQADGNGNNLPRIGKGRKVSRAAQPIVTVESIVGRKPTASKPLTNAEERAYNSAMKRVSAHVGETNFVKRG